MNCISCRLDAGYNRAVVDTLSGVELGGYCVRCEREEFGRSLAGGAGLDCAFCDRDGFYALPVWTAHAVETDEVVQSRVTYEVGETTVRVCDEHLHYLRGEPVHGNAATNSEHARR